MQTVTIKLGGQEYVVEEAPRKRNANWRKKLQDNLEPAAVFLESLPSIELDTGQDAAVILRKLIAGVNGSLDVIWDLVVMYAPTVEADQDKLQEEVRESEIIEAFLKILPLGYPFGTVVPLAQDLIQRAGSLLS